jgi:hypothetical protein
MDPTRCYRDLLANWNAEEYEAAYECARALNRWFRRGGFYPEDRERSDVDDLLHEILNETPRMIAMVEPNYDE